MYGAVAHSDLRPTFVLSEVTMERDTASILGRPAGSSRRLRNEGLEADHIENGDELPKQFGHRLDLLARPKETGSFRHHSNVPTSSSALSALPILSRFRL